MNNIDFIAIDFETATAKRASICEAGICVVKGGKVVETKSWLVRPEDNRYDYWNIRVHGIQPSETANAPMFPEVWAEITDYFAGMSCVGSPQCFVRYKLYSSFFRFLQSAHARSRLLLFASCSPPYL